MNAIRDALPPEKRPLYERAMNGFAAAFAAARARRDDLYVLGGARAVAEAAYVPGGPSVEELAAGYERLAEQARGERPTAA